MYTTPALDTMPKLAFSTPLLCGVKATWNVTLWSGSTITSSPLQIVAEVDWLDRMQSFGMDGLVIE